MLKSRYIKLLGYTTMAISMLWIVCAWQPLNARNTDTASGSVISGQNEASHGMGGETGNNGVAITAHQDQRSVLSNNGAFRVELTPLDDIIPLLELHDWTARIYDLESRRYIHPEHISLSGGMKAHGHGLPTTPRPEARRGDSYRITGVRFNMAGRWHLLIKFVYRGTPDSALFELEFAPEAHVPETTSKPVVDWTAGEIALLKSLSLLSGTVKPNHTGNAHSNDLPAAEFGQKLFFDKRLSAAGHLACASCHNPATYFNDQLTTGVGLEQLNRNTPTLVGAGLHRWLYWDGRRDSLWSQALVPLEAPAEMGSSRVAVVRSVAEHYRDEYESIFGLLPPLPGTALVTNQANPTAGDHGRKLWNTIDAETRHQINTVFTNVGKAIAAYEMKLLPAPARFDHYVEQLSEQLSTTGHQGHNLFGDSRHTSNDSGHSAKNDLNKTVMSSLELQGMKLFISNRTQCMNCHSSPMFSNYGFHNIGTGITKDGVNDFGRMMGSQAVLYNEFNCRSRYADRNSSETNGYKQGECIELKHINQQATPTAMQGAFRVPGLRGLEKTAPYMHDGRYESLAEVIRHYAEPPAYLLGQFHEMPKIESLQANEIDALSAFLLTLGSNIAAEQRWLEAPAR